MGSSQSTSNETDTTQVVLESDDEGEVKISKRRLSREELDELTKELNDNLNDRNVTIDLEVYKSIGADLGIEFDDDEEEEEEEEEYYDEIEPYELVEPIETPDSFSMTPGVPVNQIGYVGIGPLELPPLYPGVQPEEEITPVEESVLEPEPTEVVSEPVSTPSLPTEPLDTIDTVGELEPVVEHEQEVIVSEEQEIQLQPASIPMLPVTDELELISESLTPAEPEIQEVEVPETVIPGPITVEPSLLEPVIPVSAIEEPAHSADVEPQQPVTVEQEEIPDLPTVEQEVVEEAVSEVVLPAEDISVEDVSVTVPEILAEESTIETVDVTEVIELVGEPESADALEDHSLLSENAEEVIGEVELADVIEDHLLLSESAEQVETPTEVAELSSEPVAVELVPEVADTVAEPVEITEPASIETSPEVAELVVELEETSPEIPPETVETSSETVEKPAVPTLSSELRTKAQTEANTGLWGFLSFPFSAAIKEDADGTKTVGFFPPFEKATQTSPESEPVPVAEPEPVQVSEPEIAPVVEADTEPVAEPIEEVVTEPIVEPIEEAVAEPVAETVVEVAAETVTAPEPLVEDAVSVEVEDPIPVESEIEPVVEKVESSLVVEVPEPAPVIEVAEPAPVIEVTEPAPVVQVAEPAPVAEVTESAAVVEVTEPAPVVEVAEPAPVIEATEPAPVVEVAEPAPVIEVTESAPVIEVAEPAPVIEVAAPIVKVAESATIVETEPDSEAPAELIAEETNELPAAESLAKSLFGEYKKQEVEKIISDAKEEGARKQAHIDADAMSNALNAERTRWRSRFSVIESNLQKRKQDISSAHSEGFSLVTSKLQIAETQETCSNNVSDLVDCYRTNPDQVLRCNQIAQSFDSCVNKALSSR